MLINPRTAASRDLVVVDIPCRQRFKRNIWWHDVVIKWKHFPRHWPFVRGIHRSLVNSPHKGQWRGALMFSLICAWMNGWVNNRVIGDLRRPLWRHCNGISDNSCGILSQIYAAKWPWQDTWKLTNIDHRDTRHAKYGHNAWVQGFVPSKSNNQCINHNKMQQFIETVFQKQTNNTCSLRWNNIYVCNTCFDFKFVVRDEYIL